MCCLCNDICERLDFQSSRIRTKNRRSRLKALTVIWFLWDVIKTHTIRRKRVGDVDPGTVVNLQISRHSHDGLWCEHLYSIQHLYNTEHLYNIPQKTSLCQQRTLSHAWTKGKMNSKVRLSLCRGTVRIPWLFHDFAKWYFSLTTSWPILNMNLRQREREP